MPLKLIDVTEEHVASMLKIEEWSKQEVSTKQRSTCYLHHVGLLHGLFFEPEDVGDMFIRNVD
jgi:hypothetical protein